MEALTQIEVDLQRVAHGGTIVGRHEGKVVFVSGGLPGERVLVEVTERGNRFDRGRVVEVIDASPGRVVPPCPIAEACGGCDWQHAAPALQRGMKTVVVREQLQRLGGWEFTGEVEEVRPTTRWRSRMRYAVDAHGRPGLRAGRSHDVVALPESGCLISADGLGSDALASYAAGSREVEVVVGEDGLTVLADGTRVEGLGMVRHVVHGREYRVGATGFWQSHTRAPEVLVDAVLEGLAPQAGETAFDLYCGVGLFAGALVDAGCRVTGVELGEDAIRVARRNVPQARFLAGDIGRLLRRLPQRCDTVVLDPPRKGAGAKVLRHVVGLEPRAIAYVACDPSALGRDTGTLRGLGWEPVSVRAFDLFPMTHHVECVAIFQPASDMASRH